MRNGILTVVLVVLLLASACGSGGEATTAPPLAPTSAPPQPTVEVTAASTPAAPAQVIAAGTFTLTMPAGDVLVVPVVQCVGVRPGEYLDLRATNTYDLAAADRVDVQVAGVHQGPGQPASLFISVIIGSIASPVFMGNVPAAPVEILSERSGRYVEVSIPNAAIGSAAYEYGKEYVISAGWRCGP